jgi:hypothetical protein
VWLCRRFSRAWMGIERHSVCRWHRRGHPLGKMLCSLGDSNPVVGGTMALAYAACDGRRPQRYYVSRGAARVDDHNDREKNDREEASLWNPR